MKAHKRIFDLDLVLMAILSAFAVTILVLSGSYNRTAALFPRLVSIIVLLCIFWTVVQRLRALSAESLEEPAAPEDATPQQVGMRWYVSLITMVVYFLLIYVIGFTWAAAVYLFVIPLLLGYRNYRLVLAIAAMWTVSFVLVFTYVVHSRIPGGMLGDFIHQLSR